MPNYTDLYQSIAASDVRGGGAKIEEDGDFTVETRDIRVEESRDKSISGGGGTLWIVEFIVLTGGSATNPDGAKRSWVAKVTRQEKAKENVKAHICACYGLEPRKVVKGALAEESVRAVVDGQCLHGMRVGLQTERITTKSGYDFTVHTWYPLTPGQITRGSEPPAGAGWELHPGNDEYAWCQATGEVRPRGEVGL